MWQASNTPVYQVYVASNRRCTINAVSLPGACALLCTRCTLVKNTVLYIALGKLQIEGAPSLPGAPCTLHSIPVTTICSSCRRDWLADNLLGGRGRAMRLTNLLLNLPLTLKLRSTSKLFAIHCCQLQPFGQNYLPPIISGNFVRKTLIWERWNGCEIKMELFPGKIQWNPLS